MIPQPIARRKPELLGKYVRSNGYGMCIGCYTRARRAGTLPDPAPKTERRNRPVVRVTATYTVACDQCGDLLTTGSSEDARRAKRRHAANHKAAGSSRGEVA